MGTFIGSLTNTASITLTNPIITHSFCIHTMPLTHTDVSSTAVTNVAHSKPFYISFCNIRGLSCYLNSVRQHLQSSKRHAVFLTETKIKPLDSNANSILWSHVKCLGYELFSSFFPNGGVCAYSAMMYKVLVYLNLISLILVLNSSGQNFLYLALQNSFAPYTAHLAQLTMKFYLIIYLRQLTNILLNFQALKSPSMLILMSAIQTSLPTLHKSLALLVVMQRSLPL